MKTKLLIYIPTYNRFPLLENLLTKLANQLSSGKYPDVAVLVSNNCSDDADYDAMAARFSDVAIRFRTNPSNLGGNANIVQGFVNAQNCEYLWLLGDDDEVTDNCLEGIYPNLEEGVNLYHIGDYESVHMREVESNLAFFTVTQGAGFGLISKVIYKVDFFKDVFLNAFEYYDTSFTHISMILSKLNSVGKTGFKCLTNKSSFTEHRHEVNPGEYSASYLGYAYLSNFFEGDERKKLVNDYLREHFTVIYELRKKSRIHTYKYRKMLGYVLLSFPSVYFKFCLRAIRYQVLAFWNRSLLVRAFRKAKRTISSK